MRELKDCDIQIKVDNKNLPVVSQTMHMGIMRSANTQESAVQENIKKARRTIYSLMGAGLHGENGLDPDTSIHLLQTYVIPILVYGLEVVLPTGSIWTSWIRFTRNSSNRFFHCRRLWRIQPYISSLEHSGWKQ